MLPFLSHLYLLFPDFRLPCNLPHFIPLSLPPLNFIFSFPIYPLSSLPLSVLPDFFSHWLSLIDYPSFFYFILHFQISFFLSKSILYLLFPFPYFFLTPSLINYPPFFYLILLSQISSFLSKFILDPLFLLPKFLASSFP